jgi:hypothetical protein
MDFVDSLFIADVGEVVADDVDCEELNSHCGDDFLFNGVCDVVIGLFNSLVQEDYFDPCASGNNGDKEMNLDVVLMLMMIRRSIVVSRIWTFKNWRI